MIKKAALITFVIFTFVIYSIHQRDEGAQAVSHVAGNTKKTLPSAASASTSHTAGHYKNGTYTGKSSDALYGYVQVKATISGGKLTTVDFLDYPHDRGNSIMINKDAMPQLQQQAIQAQSAHVDGVSGATDTSQAFIQSLGDALAQAQA